MPHPVLEKLAELFPDNGLEHEWADEDIGQNAMSQLDNIFTILDGMKNHPLTSDNEIIRKILKCVSSNPRIESRWFSPADSKWRRRWSSDVNQEGNDFDGSTPTSEKPKIFFM